MNLIKTFAYQLHFFVLVASLGLGTPTVAPAQNNGNWALQQQRMMQSQRATQQAQQAQRAAQEAARLRQQQMIEQQRRQQALAAQQKAMREQQRIQREQQQALRAQREQQKQLRDQQQAQRTQQQAVRTQRQQQEAARQTREQQERQRLETAQRQATQTAQRQSTLTAAQQLTIRNRLQQTEQTKRLEEARRRAQQALERRKADEARTRAETNAVVAARSSGGTATAGGSNGAGQPPRPPVAAAAAAGGRSGKPPSRQAQAANQNAFYARGAVQAAHVNVAAMPKRLQEPTSSGLRLAADPNRTTTILGNYSKDMGRIIRELKYPTTYDYGPKKGGFNVLNTPLWTFRTRPEFWEKHNKPFLEAAVRRGDRIVLATKPAPELLSYQQSGKTHLTGFGRELKFLEENGYTYDSRSNTMIKR